MAESIRNRTLNSASAHLLVIDDEPLILKSVKSILTRADYAVTTCDKPSAGLKLLGEKAFDCVITDVLMPEMTGYEFVKSVRKNPQYSTLPILMLTRKRHRDDVKKAVEAGVSDYVLKPIDEALFLDKVELCLKKGLGKRHIFELPMQGPLSNASIQMSCSIISLSESDLTLWSQMPLAENTPFLLKTRLFHEMNIDIPQMKIIQCDLMPSSAKRSAGYLIKLSFLGLGEVDLRKIRNWIQKEVFRQKE